MFPLPSRRQFVGQAAAIAASGLLARQRIGQAAQRDAINDLIVRSADPLNAEPALAALVEEELTSTKRFYIRNHGPIPSIDVDGFKLRIEGFVSRPREFALGELRERFQQSTSVATLTCAGNRRQEMTAIKPVSGVQWDAGAIGTARWTGALLAEVLRAAEIQSGARHVWFEGLDPVKEKDGSVAPFGGSIPLETALAMKPQVLLAHSMNDQPLTAEHGFPLRTVVPGFIGARSVKWLAKIVVSDRPSPNHYVAEAYKVVPSDDKAALAAADPIYVYPLNAAICSPAAGAKVPSGPTAVSGYALPAGFTGSRIETVELSLDGGQTWTRAELRGRAQLCCWQLWTAQVNLAPGRRDLVVRAKDLQGQSMPEKGNWNFKGYLYNGWHHVRVEVS